VLVLGQAFFKLVNGVASSLLYPMRERSTKVGVLTYLQILD
jgi:hypothetical protein